MPAWLPTELFKAIAQAIAVTIGIFLGWRLNSRSQQRERVRQVRADWAGAAEECLGAIEAHHESWLRFQAEGGLEVDTQKRGDVIERRRVLDAAKAKLRSATMRLILVDAHPARGVDVIAIEDAILATERTATHHIHPQARTARERVRATVEIWTGRKTAVPAKELSPGSAAAAPPGA